MVASTGSATEGTGSATEGTGQPPKGQAQPPKGQAQPPKEQAQPPKEQAQPPKEQAQPSKGQAQPPFEVVEFWENVVVELVETTNSPLNAFLSMLCRSASVFLVKHSIYYFCFYYS